MESNIKIKVCGMRSEENIREVASLGIDYMGFIFYERSPRFCSALNPSVLRDLPSDIDAVAVTVDMNENEILELEARYGFNTFQLHGNESPSLCMSLRNRGLRVIKAMPAGGDAGSLEALHRYVGSVDLFLLDTACESRGGSGKKFDWRLLRDYELDVDFILSGGIGPEDVESIKKIDYRRLAGIDLNSRFETAPGVKDARLIAEFIEKIRL